MIDHDTAPLTVLRAGGRSISRPALRRSRSDRDVQSFLEKARDLLRQLAQLIPQFVLVRVLAWVEIRAQERAQVARLSASHAC